MVCMKVIKKNQVVIFAFALMLIAAGYMNYSRTSSSSLETAGLMDSEQVAGIGDAQLVNSNNVVDESNQTTSETTNKNETIENSENQSTTEKNQTLQTSATTNENYFTNSKIEREKMYSQMLETYQKILESNSISAEQKAIAQEEISKIHNIKNRIMIAENLIKNKGFNNVIIFVNDDSISVIIDTEKLENAEIAQIQNIVSREIDADIDDIHISQK